MQFRFDSCPVSIDRAESEMKLIADLAGAASMPDQLEDLEFSIGQLSHTVFAFSAKSNSFENAGGDPSRQINFAPKNSANGGHHFSRNFVLGDITTRAGFEDAFRVKRFIVHRKN